MFSRADWDLRPERMHEGARFAFLAPVLGQLGIERHSASAWAAAGSGALELVGGPQDAEVVALPAHYDVVPEAAVREAAATAERAGCTLLLFGHTDHYRPPAAVAPRTLLFHSDLRRSKAKPYERSHPTPLVYEMEPAHVLEGHTWEPHPFEPRPKVFWRGAGHLGGLPPHKQLGFRAMRNWRLIRLRTARALVTAAEVRFDSAFSGGWWQLGPEERLASRRAFLQDALASPYGLVVRGSGNYSFRLYELMALGRIPLVVDTDSVLPWPERIPWEEISVRVPYRSVRRIGPLLHAFHRRFAADPAAFAALQERIRSLWTAHLSEVGFYRTVCEQLRAEL